MKLNNIAYQDIVAGGVSEGKFANVKNYGLELEALGRFDQFHINVNATLQDPKYSDFKGNGFNYDNNQARRIPKFYFIVRPDYNITKDLNVYMKYSHFGKKFNDEGNTFVLAGFNVFDAGVSYKMNNIRFGIDATNIFNTIGLTEGDGDWKGKNNGDVVFARSIVGAAARASITLDF
ncbi:TonB-dependent receptor domain-containing protein [Epilithonimonas sp.]|uniref:TonB-dependent receptor domain-containing protein n=1 Tax=Epilithonimonas sp. TaxID=2894511 RepID=UPI0035B39581